MFNIDNFDFIVNLLPYEIRETVKHSSQENLVDIILDVDRAPKLRYVEGFELLDFYKVTPTDIDFINDRMERYTVNNRAGIPNTLHRVSRIVNLTGETTGFTIRCSRVIEGLETPLEPYLNGSVLLVGKPGAGKTSRLRSIAKYLSDVRNMETIIVDKSNEIAGHNNAPHACVGLARRMMVRDTQAKTMMEAVENHTPHAIIVDEIRDRDEAQAAKTIAERGVQLIATAHGTTLASLVRNPIMQVVLGNVKPVVIGDESAKKLGLERKTINERELPPTFDHLIEIIAYDEVAAYSNLEKSIDALLSGGTVQPKIMRLHDGKWITIQEEVCKDPINPEFLPESIGAQVTSKRKTKA